MGAWLPSHLGEPGQLSKCISLHITFYAVPHNETVRQGCEINLVTFLRLFLYQSLEMGIAMFALAWRIKRVFE